MHWQALAALAALAAASLIACGGDEGAGGRPLNVARTLPPIRSAATHADFAALVSDIFAREFCDRIAGQFVGLPDRYVKDAIGGRWWIRGCSPPSIDDNGNATLKIGGPGWTWVDESTLGHTVRDHVFFSVIAQLTGRIDAGYAARQVAWVQFTPLSEPILSASSASAITANPSLLGIVARVATLHVIWGTPPDEKARAEFDRQLTAGFTTRLRTGFGVTYELRNKQFDVLTLSGPSPTRPFSDGEPWLLNERQVLRRKPGGFQVAGPFPPTTGGAIDFFGRKGSVKYRPECETDVLPWFETIADGRGAHLPASTNTQGGIAGVGMLTRRVAMLCRWYLITEAHDSDEAILDIRVRGRTLPYLEAPAR